MRTRIVAGNWKMNNDLDATRSLLMELKDYNIPENTRVLVAPAFTSLQEAAHILKGTQIEVAAQNMHQASGGAFTGEVSATMLQSLGVDTVILGHSERRAYFGETNTLLAEKMNTAVLKGMTVIFCFGEELSERKEERHFEVVKTQLKEGLFHLKEQDWKRIILAYEPVWAIGTGETATPEQAQEIHQFVRWTLANQYSKEIAEGVSILYGGSVKPGNAKEIFGQPDVDGGLIGGASLDASSFRAIIKTLDV